MRAKKALYSKGLWGFLLALVLIVSMTMFSISSANAAALTAAELKLSDSRPSTASVTYTTTVSSVSLSAVKCIKMVFATTATGTTLPTAMNTQGALTVSGTYFTGGSGTTNLASWTKDQTANGTVLLTDATGGTPGSASTRTVVLAGITNGSTAGTAYYMQFSTYNNTNCSSSGVDSVTVAYMYVSGQAVTVTVDPALSFTITGSTAANYNDASHCSGITNGIVANVTTTSTTVPLGTPTVGANSIGMQLMTLGTNAGTGTYVYTWVTGNLTNGSRNIANVSGTNAAPVASGTGFASGTEAWGYSTSSNLTTGVNLADNRFASDKWAAYTTSANTDHVFYANGIPVDSSTATGSGSNYAGGKFCMAYQVGISSLTRAGTYSTTVVYNVLPAY